MKIDLRWDYNNVRIKKGDEWKVVFIISEGLLEPTVMFFDLTNSLATFQAMINELLINLINIGKIAVFINNVMVGMETEEEHNELVEEILRRMEENNLYIKLEKHKWNIRKVRFLEVVIGLKEIKMKEEKVKTVLD